MLLQLEQGGDWGVDEDRSRPGKDGIISTATSILFLFLSSICPPEFTQTCTSYVADADASRPSGAARAYPRAREQMFPYIVETFAA